MGKLAEVSRRCKLAALDMVYKAGRGHLGTSFSSMDIIVAMRSLMKTGDIFISSKGHDSPAQYSVLAEYGILPPERLDTLRKPGGLPGHPTVDVPGIVANTGSLGMGLSKACGFVEAWRLRGLRHRAFVLLGDGEMSEGQNYEAMLYAARREMGELCVAVDCNGWGQDGPAAMDSGTILAMFRAAGWASWIVGVEENADTLSEVFVDSGNMPMCWVTEREKGQGVSFMEEHPEVWHQRAPNADEYARAREELGG